MIVCRNPDKADVPRGDGDLELVDVGWRMPRPGASITVLFAVALRA